MGNDSVSVAIIGPSGIGRVHIREFLRAGAKIAGVMGSTPRRSIQSVHRLNEEFGVTTTAYNNLNAIIASSVDIICICSPTNIHYQHLEACLPSDKYVYCEKPLFWDHSLALPDVLKRLTVLEKHSKGRLLVNTSNIAFVNAALEATNGDFLRKAFLFRLNTRSPYTYDDVGPELLPHALSLALMLRPDGKIKNLRRRKSRHYLECDFDFSGMGVRFVLGCDPKMDKIFEFAIDGSSFKRIQKSELGEYSVFLSSAEFNDGIKEIEDPFKSNAKRLIQAVKTKSLFDSETEKTFRIMELMAEILLCD